ncbi:conserved oligomeric Golgi complex subunit 7-like [Limulus polyphemus]|uniref:Conserved oligomeric Golgi complex subunit 7 n=1 Tax=Limulus polyphemus TaxID=6850 RepID=A0ABM1S4Y8_LIMPO|nr:conserved oligomeric Golgi complex subunit 7-like [Limulus polyphemus]
MSALSQISKVDERDCHPLTEHLLQQWRQIVEIDPDGTITDWLNNFYDILSSTWHSQTSWLGQVFLDLSSVEILSEVIVDVLSSLEPSLHFCIKAALKQQDSPLLFLIDLKQITDRFARGIELAITSFDSDNLQKPHTAMLAQTLYAPYRPLIEKYASLEGRLLHSQLSTVCFVRLVFFFFIHTCIWKCSPNAFTRFMGV